MKEFSYTIKDAQGIHARPAGLLVKEASKFSSEIIIEFGDKKGDAKKIFSVMSMGINTGDTVTVKSMGQDEENAKNALFDFFTNNL